MARQLINKIDVLEKLYQSGNITRSTLSRSIMELIPKYIDPSIVQTLEGFSIGDIVTIKPTKKDLKLIETNKESRYIQDLLIKTYEVKKLIPSTIGKSKANLVQKTGHWAGGRMSLQLQKLTKLH